jgi:transposase
MRIYSAVPRLPFGRQLQLDFGEYKMDSGNKLYFLAAVLSASRYKIAAFQEHPITSSDAIEFLLDVFKEIGGRPQELVIDQDAVLVASEKAGYIQYTRLFGKFIEEQELKVFVCRKADPESKGKIENLVGYIKGSFLSARTITSSTEANRRCREWLKRRANGRPSSATGHIPQELLQNERKHLKPLRLSIFSPSTADSALRKVSSLCEISYKAKKYSCRWHNVL